MYKKYQVNVHYDAVITVPNIIAESEEEAIAIAKERAATQSLNEAEVVNDNACVSREEDIPEKGMKAPSAAELSDEQLELLDEFVAAARNLNEAGVSLFYNGDANALAVVNRDVMQDESFFSRDDKRIASDPKSKSVFDNLTASLEVDINYIDHELDHLFIPKKN